MISLDRNAGVYRTRRRDLVDDLNWGPDLGNVGDYRRGVRVADSRVIVRTG